VAIVAAACCAWCATVARHRLNLWFLHALLVYCLRSSQPWSPEAVSYALAGHVQ
jgi:hypothetical protein